MGQVRGVRGSRESLGLLEPLGKGLQQMNTRSRSERTVGITAGIEKDLERGIESGSPWCSYYTGGKGMTHFVLGQVLEIQPRAWQ